MRFHESPDCLFVRNLITVRNILLVTTYSFEHGKLMELNPINYRSKTIENKLKKHNEDIV